MPSTALTHGAKPSKMSIAFDKLLTLLEKVSDENFWNGLLGERALNLLKRYFGSDVVFLGFVVYLAPIVGYQFHQLLAFVMNKFNESLYVSIQISRNENGYDAIQQFLSSKTTHIKDQRNVEGRCIFNGEWDDDEEWGEKSANPPPRLVLYPLDEVQNEIQYKGHMLWVTKKKNGDINNQNQVYSNDIKDLLGAMNSNPCIQITMRGQDMNLLKSFIQEWINMHYEQENGKLQIYKCVPSRYDGFEWSTVGSKELRSFESVILKEGQKERILKDIQSFRRREHWYSNRGIPYRRGYLLYGPPGTGKTSLVQSVASKVNMNVAIISLSGSMDDEKFNVMLQEVPHNSILIMEDIDHCVIRDPSSGKDNVNAKITMSGLLNALDGVAAQEGAMIFMSCNDVNRLQPALLRPGRIDMKMELGYADKAQVRQMFWRFLWDEEETTLEVEGGDPLKKEAPQELKDLADRFVDMIPDGQITPAEIQNFFILNIMDMHEELVDHERDYTYLLDNVPAFLETVAKDRKQAQEHKEINNNNKNEDEEPVQDDEEKEKDETKEVTE
ncbi:P-loop containing nucleoside triphosphate hydrolase protein [Sporodiniella umbellata]|nr:P-loop containing nucleoside triphosphate hydrolase protein [Sporodiniella umbellata]